MSVTKSQIAILLVPSLLAILVLGSMACDYSGERLALLVTVGSELQDCEGVVNKKCLEVNGELFYNTIEGFSYEEGFIYRLRVERTDLYHGEDNPPQDESRYRYRLLEQVSKLSTAPVR